MPSIRPIETNREINSWAKIYVQSMLIKNPNASHENKHFLGGLSLAVVLNARIPKAIPIDDPTIAYIRICCFDVLNPQKRENRRGSNVIETTAKWLRPFLLRN